MNIELTKDQIDKINNLGLTISECIYLGLSGIIQMSEKIGESEASLECNMKIGEERYRIEIDYKVNKIKK